MCDRGKLFALCPRSQPATAETCEDDLEAWLKAIPKEEAMVAAGAAASTNRTKAQLFHEYLATGGAGKTVLNVLQGETIFRQGDPADSVFHIQKGRVKISVISPQGKEATLAFHGKGNFIGEESVARSQVLRLVSAVAILPTTVLRIESTVMVKALASDQSLTQHFQIFLLTRCMLMQADLIDHLFNSSEKRLARTLLLLSQLDTGTEAVVQDATQETLAEMIGTTRSRVSFFMNRFRKMGYIQYNGCNRGINVYRSLFNVLLKD